MAQASKLGNQTYKSSLPVENPNIITSLLFAPLLGCTAWSTQGNVTRSKTRHNQG
jgi:hypothetical protein